MSRPQMVLTGPQAVAIGVLAGLGWTYRTSLRAAGHFIRCGPNILGFFDGDDFDDEIAEQRIVLDLLAASNPGANP